MKPKVNRKWKTDDEKVDDEEYWNCQSNGREREMAWKIIWSQIEKRQREREGEGERQNEKEEGRTKNRSWSKRSELKFSLLPLRSTNGQQKKRDWISRVDSWWYGDEWCNRLCICYALVREHSRLKILRKYRTKYKKSKGKAKPI